MKVTGIVLALIFVYLLTTSFQCQQCGTGTLRLNGSKSWLPLKGKTQLTFLDQSGALAIFPMRVVDTTEIGINDCGEPFQYEYITTSLYLNQGKTDSIHFSLSSSDWLCMRAMSSNNPNITMCNVFGHTKEGAIARRLNNYTVGTKTYQEVILLHHNPGYSDNIDSVFIANNAGIVGFMYANKRYALQ